MRVMNYFNGQMPTVNHLSFDSAGKDVAIRHRWSNHTVWGIIRANAYPADVSVPVSAMNAVPNYAQNILQAPITLDTATGLVGVGLGSNSSVNPNIVGLVAFDINGQRIAIENDADFNFSTVSPYGSQSTGNRNIPLVAGVTSGNASNVAPVSGTYYLWITYLPVNLSTPVTESSWGQTPGAIHYPYVDDGYQIQITTSPIAPEGDGQSIFLCKVTWAPGYTGILTVTDGTASNGSGQNVLITNSSLSGDPNRVYCGIKAQDVEITLDTTNPTTEYASGMITSLLAHIQCFGTGPLGPHNPHSLGPGDIGINGSEPVAIQYQADSLANGVVDLNISQNSPIFNSSALQPVFGVGSITPATPLDPNASVVSAPSVTQDRWVRIHDLDNLTETKAVYVDGQRLRQIYPGVRQSNLAGDSSIVSSDPLSGDGWIGFSAANDATGYYYLYGQYGTLTTNAEVLFIGKSYLGSSTVVPSLAENQILIGRCYWDAASVQLYRNSTEMTSTDIGNQPDDLRILGLVGPQQLSTTLKSDPAVGALANEVTENLVSNSNFALSLLNFTQYPLTGTPVVPFSGGSNPTAITAATDSTLASGGPGAISGLTFTTNSGAAGALGTSRLYHLLDNLKPGRMYGFSFWYKASNTFNVRLRAGLNDGAGSFGAPNSFITQDGETAFDSIDITINNDGNWHRASVVFQVLPSAYSGPNPDPSVAKYLQFRFDQGNFATTAGQFTMTNLQVTEGEWIPGFQGARKTVPSGGIFLWDQTSSCPEGSTLVGSPGLIPIAVNPTGSNGMQSPGNSLGTAIVNGSIPLPAHTHQIPLGSSYAQGSGAASSDITTVNGTAGSLQGVLNLGLYTMLFCRLN